MFIRVAFLTGGILLAFVVVPVFAQSDNNASTRLGARLESLTSRYSTAAHRTEDDADPEQVRRIFQSDIVDSLQFARSRLSRAYQSFVAQDWGLKASGGYIYNFSDGFEEAGFFYRRSYNVGFDWNLLKEGWLDNRFNARQEQYRDAIARIRTDNDRTAQANFVVGRLSATFERDLQIKKAFVLQFLTEYERLARDLYLGRYILWEDFLSVANEKTALSIDVENAVSSAHQALRPHTECDRLPALSLLEGRLVASINGDRVDSILNLRDEENRLRYSYLNEISLRPFLRYNHYTYSTVLSDRDFFTGGISFAVPLPVRRTTKDELRTASRTELRRELQQRRQSDMVRINELVHAYQKNSTEYVQRVTSCHLIEEQLRQESVKKRFSDPEYSALRTLDLIRQWLNCDLASLEIKRDLYMILARLSAMAGVAPETFTVPMNIATEKFTLDTFTEKAVYVWSRNLREYSATDLAEGIGSRGFSKAIVSVDMNDTLRLKAHDLVSMLKQKDVAVELMLANNSLILRENSETLASAIRYNLELPGTTGIHLDIEPHVRPEWDQQRDTLMRAYQKMIVNAARLTSGAGRHLAISIPLSYDLGYLAPVRENIQSVYVMTYEHTDAAYIAEKVKDEIEMFGDKVVLALRIEDFNSTQAMDKFIAELKQATGIGRFAVHDYGRLVQMEKMEINNK